MLRHEALIRKLSVKEKIRLCTGGDFWHTCALSKWDIPAVKVADGPHGVRCQEGKGDMLGLNDSLPATCFPTAVTSAASWDLKLLEREGRAIGEEGAAMGLAAVLGPGANIKRDPRCGRNFEYFSEDPLLSGKLAAAWIRGEQSAGPACSLKHFAANSQEAFRGNGNSLVDERTLREIYLRSFEIAVKEGGPRTVMCAYPRLNGAFCSDNRWLLTTVLREEWGFDGLVMTDWGALNDRVAAFQAGCDLNMPGGSKYGEKSTLKAIKENTLSETVVERSVDRVLDFVWYSPQKSNGTFDHEMHHRLAREIAEAGAVLLQNRGGVLPCHEEDIVLIGYMAGDMRYQGAGSSHINPTRLVQLTDALPGAPWVSCCSEDGSVTAEGIAQAIQAAQKARVAVVVAGLPASWESEGFDRENLTLPEGHNQMIRAVAEVNPRTVVVLLGGGVMELPWQDQVAAILYMGLPGQAGGEAAARLLTGKAIPSGKLAETWPLSLSDVICRNTFGKKVVEYREGLYVGYRYYESAGVPVRFPFGHGLSYTTFAYDSLTVAGESPALRVSARVTNVGHFPGSEVMQLYTVPSQGGPYRPAKELRGFEKIFLKPGESRTVTFTLDERDFSLWQEGWRRVPGRYHLQIGASCRDIRLETEILVPGTPLTAPGWQRGSWYETPQGRPDRQIWEKLMGGPVPQEKTPGKGYFDRNSTLREMREQSWLASLACRITKWVVAKKYRGDISSAEYKMMYSCAVDAPVRHVVINSGGLLPEGLADFLVKLANGRPFANLRKRSASGKKERGTK